nr:immunoglobulin heavy chain junction region [Mus musculus]MBK4183928.1 immunoglobulin heavy chain junction region [Mus musculus]
CARSPIYYGNVYAMDYW